MQAAAQDTTFRAMITPHRSLSARGMRILAGALCLLSVVSSALSWLLGAWPVIGFSGIETGLALLLLRLNARGVRNTELLTLSPDGLRIVRTDQKGRQTERSLSPAWLNVVLQERPGRVPGLWLTSHGVREEIAARLGEDEKRDLAGALKDTLHRLRNPIFDNPQLRN